MTVDIKPATESEKTVLGALLIESSNYIVINSMLCGADFSCESHAKVFEAIRELYDQRGTFDMAMVSDHGGIRRTYLETLVQDCVSTANIKAHAEIIREKSVQRQLVAVAQEIAEAATQ